VGDSRDLGVRVRAREVAAWAPSILVFSMAFSLAGYWGLLKKHGTMRDSRMMKVCAFEPYMDSPMGLLATGPEAEEVAQHEGNSTTRLAD
jgi:hypothetical protein